MRDDFSEDIKRIVASHAGYCCSNPDCRAPTIGHQTNPKKTLCLGVAVHITASSLAKLHYNPSLKFDERKHIDNAIWLCQTCAELVENDEERFTESILIEWKKRAEEPYYNTRKHQNYSYRSSTSKALSVMYDIFLDFILVAFLLITLSLIHIFIDKIPLSEGFKVIFTIIHESLIIANYLLLAYKSIIRLWQHL